MFSPSTVYSACVSMVISLKLESKRKSSGVIPREIGTGPEVDILDFIEYFVFRAHLTR